jgi:large subunit ribosomal protein L47
MEVDLLNRSTPNIFPVWFTMASLIRISLQNVAKRCTRGIERFWAGGQLDPRASPEVVSANTSSGDAWPAVLLRMKSFEDLHKLWHVLLKEKNFLLTERQHAKAYKTQWKGHGRLKKVKLSMKRLLTVLSRRVIHEQTVRAKELLEKQTIREGLETKRFHLEEQILQLQQKIKSMGNAESLAKVAWVSTLRKCETDLEAVKEQLVPLRKETMQLLIPDWRFSHKYSDLPGNWRWKKEWVRALEERKPNFIREY